MLLWKCIGGQGKTGMISHLSPNPLSKATNATLDVAGQSIRGDFEKLDSQIIKYISYSFFTMRWP